MTRDQSAARAAIDAFYRERLEKPRGDSATPSLLAPDYDAVALAGLPEELAGTSFGCGDPLAFADVRRGETVLDLGCGTGLDLLIAAEATGPDGKVIGVDMSDDMIMRARRNAARAGASQVEVLKGAIEAVPMPDRSVDWVISNCVVNLSLDKQAVFSEIARVLKPGGRIVISDIVVDDLPEWVEVHSDLYAACLSGAVSQPRYLRLAAEAGLSHAKIADTLVYDAAALRHLIETELPVALGGLAERLDLTTEAMIDRAVADLCGKVKAIKLTARAA